MGIDMKMNHEVTSIDINSKTVEVKNLKTGEVSKDKYDKLVLTLGSWPIVPKFEGGELDNILLCKNYDHAKKVIEKSKIAKNIAVIGAGYIGVELAEAFEIQGTLGIKNYDQCIASTGMTEDVARLTTAMNIGTTIIKENHRPEFMPTYSEAMIKVVYDKNTNRVIGGQIISEQDLTQFMNTLSLAIQNHMTLEELAVTDFFFQPQFNKPWSLLNSVALRALE